MPFLSEIVRETRRSVAAPDYGSGLPDRALGAPSSLRAAIERDRARGALVAEFKRNSPGRENPVLPVQDVDRFVRAGSEAGVAAFSCIATEPVFGGSPQDVAALAAVARNVPVVFKDFVVDRRQLAIAARSGASAVLLIARLETEHLLDEPLAKLAEEAHRLGLEVLLEFHERTELRAAAGVGADVFGVNTRDLDSLAIDRAVASTTISDAIAAGMRPLLGLSGIESPDDAADFWNQGVDGVLVGTAVARSGEAARFLASLRRPPTEASP